MEKYLIVDGNNLLYSSYHASQKLFKKIKKGTIFIFLRVLISILKKTDYQKLLITFDGGGTNFRTALLPHYKAQRASMPEELWVQMEELKSLLLKTNITYIQLKDWEADDVIASFITQNAKKDTNLTFDIFTRDKDLLQLINENTNILKYIKGKITLYTRKDFQQEYNFCPSSYVDYLSLLGDNVDNIEGVKGIGPVGAKNLIHQFSTAEKIYRDFNKIIENLPDNTKKLLENKQELVFRNKKIISLEKNISLPSGEYNFNWTEWKNNSELRKFCQDNRFGSILKSLH